MHDAITQLMNPPVAHLDVETGLMEACRSPVLVLCLCCPGHQTNGYNHGVVLAADTEAKGKKDGE